MAYEYSFGGSEFILGIALQDKDWGRVSGSLDFKAQAADVRKQV